VYAGLTFLFILSNKFSFYHAKTHTYEKNKIMEALIPGGNHASAYQRLLQTRNFGQRSQHIAATGNQQLVLGCHYPDAGGITGGYRYPMLAGQSAIWPKRLLQPAERQRQLPQNQRL
jgi:hypothetical protein